MNRCVELAQVSPLSHSWKETSCYDSDLMVVHWMAEVSESSTDPLHKYAYDTAFALTGGEVGRAYIGVSPVVLQKMMEGKVQEVVEGGAKMNHKYTLNEKLHEDGDEVAVMVYSQE